MTRCQAFLLCENPAVGVADHPVLGSYPSCQRCADRLEKNLKPLPPTKV